MNYILIRQREDQQGFFSEHQAALFTIYVTIGQEHRNLAIISNYIKHTTAFVYYAPGNFLSNSLNRTLRW